MKTVDLVHRILVHRTKSDHFDLDNLGDDEFDVKIEGVSDPCTEAALFWGDQALSEDDVQDCLLFSQYFQCIFSVFIRRVHKSMLEKSTRTVDKNDEHKNSEFLEGQQMKFKKI